MRLKWSLNSVQRRITCGLALALALNGQSTLSVAPAGPCGGVNRVTMKVIVTDQDGKATLDLKRTDFSVTEDGRKQEIAAFAVQGPGLDYSAPATGPGTFRFLNLITLLFDFAATPVAERTRIQDYAIDFIRNDLKPGELVSIELVIAGRIETIQYFTDDQSVLVAALNKFRDPGDAAPGAIASVCANQDFALQKSVLFFQTPGGASAVANQAALDAAVNDCTKFAIAVYPVGAPPVSVAEFATKTGGRTFPLARLAMDDLRRKSGVYYFIGYYPTNSKRDGGHRKVELKLTRPGLEHANVEYSPGYFADLPPAPSKVVCF